eukprot:TRINITY_DN12171_c0_g1_i1.p1 TRINITY_DN12171_c0_g1~~TRINITY_DN12171_c0_g1_i1.p1  ORF type:complete len:1014 (-),score=207.86 TRINITY_DN12171_c0_g1_i1:71-3070(-)
MQDVYSQYMDPLTTNNNFELPEYSFISPNIYSLGAYTDAIPNSEHDILISPKGETEPSPTICDTTIDNIMINNASIGTVRDDKLNNITITLDQNLPIIQYDVQYVQTFLYDETNETIQSMIDRDQFRPGILYTFFSLKPRFGHFKPWQTADSLVHVDNIKKENEKIEYKVYFRRTLRPSHSLEPEFQKKKKNWMNIQVILIYQREFVSPVPNFVFVSVSTQFSFRSNSGKNNRQMYTKKRKISSTESKLLKPDTGYILRTPTEDMSPPTVYRIHPNQGFAFQVWEYDNEDVTIVLLGDNLDSHDISVFFVNPFTQDLCQAFPKTTPYRDREFFVPSIKRLFNDIPIAFPEEGLKVKVVFHGVTVKSRQAQEYTYLNINPAAQMMFFGVVPSNNESHSMGTGFGSMGGNNIYSSNSQNTFNQVIESPDILHYYRQCGIDITRVDRNKRGILHFAVIANYEEIAKFAIASGCDVSRKDKFLCTPLHLAIFYRRMNIINILLSHGCTLEEDCNGETPLDLAIKWRETEIIDCIIRNNWELVDDMYTSIVGTDTNIGETLALLSSYSGSYVAISLGYLPYLPDTEKFIALICLNSATTLATYSEDENLYFAKVETIISLLKEMLSEDIESSESILPRLLSRVPSIEDLKRAKKKLTHSIKGSILKVKAPSLLGTEDRKSRRKSRRKSKNSSISRSAIFEQFSKSAQELDLLSGIPGHRIKRIHLNNSLKKVRGDTVVAVSQDESFEGFNIHTHENGVIFCMVNGIEKESSNASKIAKIAFVSHVERKITEARTLQDVANILVSACAFAHWALLRKATVLEPVEILGGIQMEMLDYLTDFEDSAYMCIKIGSGRAFHMKGGGYTEITDTQENSTFGLGSITDVQNNMNLYITGCEKGDIFLQMSNDIYNDSGCKKLIEISETPENFENIPEILLNSSKVDIDDEVDRGLCFMFKSGERPEERSFRKEFGENISDKLIPKLGNNFSDAKAILRTSFERASKTSRD